MLKRNYAVVRSLLVVLLFFAVSGRDAQAGGIYTLHWITVGNNNVPVIRIAFKDGKTRLFVLDTGAESTVMDRQVAAELHLSASKITQRGPAGTKYTLEVVSCPANLGPNVLSLPSVPFMVSDLSAMRRAFPGMAGIVGMNMLTSFILRMDYSKKQVDLILGHIRSAPSGTTSSGTNSTVILPLTRAGNHYNVAGTLDGVKIKFFLDTGTGNTFINEPAVLKALKPKAILGDIRIAIIKHGSSSQMSQARVMRLGELKLGKLTFKDPIIQQAGVDFEANGLGNDILQRFQVVIDFPGQNLYLTPDPNYKEKPGLPGPMMQFANGLSPSSAVGSISFERASPTSPPLVSISLNGGKPHLFLFDPGEPDCVLDKTVVTSEQLPNQLETTEANTKLKVCRPEKMVFNAPVPFSIAKVPFLVGDLSQLRRIYGPEVVGVLGSNLLGLFLEKIDFSKQKIEFLLRADAMPAGKQGHLLSLQEEEGDYYLKAKVDGQPTRFGISFMSPSTMLQDAPLLSKLKPVAKVHEVKSDGSAGEQMLRLQTLRVEELVWTSPVVSHSLAQEAQVNVFGMDFFSRFYVTLDLGGGQISLEPDPNFKDDIKPWLRTGYIAGLTADGKLRVSGLYVPSSAAEAGIKAGDEILEINGVPTATTPLASLANSVLPVEGTIVKVKIQRMGEEKPREFTLRLGKLL